MAAILSTNMASLYAQKNLSTAQASLSESVQRLSSGTRINSAKDDAAGFGISESVRGTKNIVDQNIRNAKDGISWAQTAEGALDVVGRILQRSLTLTTQAMDRTLNSTQLTSIAQELNALGDEINNIAVRTKFQGGSAQASVFGSVSLNTSGNPVNGSAAVTRSGSIGVSTGSGTNTTVTANMVDLTAAAGFTSIARGIEGFRLGNPILTGDAATGRAANAALAVNSSSVPALTAGDKVYINGVDSGLTVTADVAAGTVTSIGVTGTVATVPAGARINFYSAPSYATAAQVTAMEGLIATNSTNRGTLGAAINSLEYAVDNMQTLSSNLADGISRIVDTDYAAETSNLTRTQILQQAATSMLAQANQMPNVILTLLK
jgi:flagellin